MNNKCVTSIIMGVIIAFLILTLTKDERVSKKEYNLGDTSYNSELDDKSDDYVWCLKIHVIVGKSHIEVPKYFETKREAIEYGRVHFLEKEKWTEKKYVTKDEVFLCP